MNGIGPICPIGPIRSKHTQFFRNVTNPKTKNAAPIAKNARRPVAPIAINATPIAMNG
jgi:hypothetical protein